MDRKSLEERLINFAVMIVEFVQSMPDVKGSSHLAGQLLRSGTSPALNYGEAQSGASRKDFIHKLKIVLKELRETNICLQIIFRLKMFKADSKIKSIIDESSQLLSIFVKSVDTAVKNNNYNSGPANSK
jgi:four helix bundle protein